MTKSLPLIFLSWFFLKAPSDILRIGKNYAAWAWSYFSLGYFLPRLFAPWRRDVTSYGRGFDLKRFFHTLLWNLISRFLGAALRLAVMAVGILVEFGIFILTILAFAIWLTLPLIIPGLLILSGITWLI